MPKDAIIINNVSKTFRIPHDRKTTLFEHISGLFDGTKGYEEFQALKNINFTVKKGEAIGIIGENGSGKSTLLKIISNILRPSSGSVKVNGKITSFLELGVGFEPNLTARENIYLQVRLAFSTAIQTDPEILLMDEVLAVGDKDFQQKCLDGPSDRRNG